MARLQGTLVRRPWWLLLGAIAVILLMAATMVSIRPQSSDVPQIQFLSLDKAQPAAQPVRPVPEVATPVTPEVRALWTSIGRTGRGHAKTVLDLQIPKRDPDSMGDGLAYMSRDPTDGKYWFTPDKGVHKYKLANIPPADFSAGFGPASGRLEEDVGTQGAFIVGEAVVLFMYTQVEPLVFENWRAEIPLSELEGLR